MAHDGYARAIHGPRVAYAWRVFAPLIQVIRKAAGGSAVFVEIERTALRWREQELLAEIRHVKEDARIRGRVERLLKRVAKLENKRAQLL